jgi:hypothetical protein
LQDLKKILQDLQNFSQKGLLVTLLIDVKKIYFMIKVVFFQKNQLGIGPHVQKWREMGQKLDFRALFSEI